MKIILLRHGQPNFPDFGKLTAYDFHRWIKAYNLAALDARNKPTEVVLERASSCNIIICSNLRRSLESAAVLGVKKIDCVDPVFREFELPYANCAWSHRSLRLSSGVWSLIYRILWFMGYSCHCESFVMAKLRANKAANILENKAQSSDTVILVGHSLLNFFIGKKLQSKGWQGSVSLFNKYWEMSVFEFSNA